MRLRNKKRRHIAEVNIRLCFPDLSDFQQQQLVEAHFQCFGCGIIDMGLSLMSSRKRLAKYVDVKGAQHFKDLPATQNVIMVAYHITNLDMGSCSLFPETPLVTMMNRDKNPVINWFLHSGRTRFKKAHLYMRDQSLRGIIGDMKKGRVCFLIPDEDYGEGKHTVYAPFFGQKRSTLNMVSRIAKKTDALVIPFTCILNPDTGRYTTIVAAPIDQVPSEDTVEDATRMNAAMETLIRQAPEQYYVDLQVVSYPNGRQ